MNDQAMAALPFINEAQIEAVLEWGPLMSALEQAMSDFSAGNVVQPVRQLVPVPGHDAIIAASAVGLTCDIRLKSEYFRSQSTSSRINQRFPKVFLLVFTTTWPNRITGACSCAAALMQALHLSGSPGFESISPFRLFPAAGNFHI